MNIIKLQILQKTKANHLLEISGYGNRHVITASYFFATVFQVNNFRMDW